METSVVMLEADLQAQISYMKSILNERQYRCYVFLGDFPTLGVAGAADVRHEVDERGAAEDGRSAVTSCAGNHDFQSFYKHDSRYHSHRYRTEFDGNGTDDSLVCQCRTAHAVAGCGRHHGCPYRYDHHGVDDVIGLCRQNTVFYEYTEARPTRENILHDMNATPPGIEPADKYYFGFYEGADLIAIMDLIDGYPEKDIAYIGFFMMDVKHQGKQIGSSIISEVISYFRTIGKTAVRLAIDKGNPQSTHFWTKNGFQVIKKADVNGWTKLVAEKSLKERR